MLNIAWPWLLLLIPLPLLMPFILPRQKIQPANALKIPFFTALQAIVQQPTSNAQILRLHFWLKVVVWVLLVFAASGPQWLGNPIDISRSGRAIMLVVDLSGSMETPDMQLDSAPATRLQVIKTVGNDFINQRLGDHIGLVLFGTRAYLQTPLTFDHSTVKAMLDDATVGLAGTQTAIGDALGIAIKRLQNHPQDQRVIVLLTDGGNNTGHILPQQAGQLAAQMGIRIYTVGLGAEHMLVPSLFGNQIINPSADLDESMLKELAQSTGGVYFRAKNTEDLFKVNASLNHLEPTLADKATLRPVTELYPWPLALALFITIGMCCLMLKSARFGP